MRINELFVVTPLFIGAVASYLTVIARVGFPLEQYMEAGTRMLEMAFGFKERDIALELATVAMKVLQGVLEQGGNCQRNKATARALSKALVRGLNRAVKNCFRDQVVDLLDNRTRMFGEAIRKNDERNAGNHSEVGMILLIAAIEEGPTEEAEIEGYWSITEYLSKSWVTELGRAESTMRPLVQKLVNRRTDEFNDFTKTGDLEHGRIIMKAAMEVLQAVIKGKSVDISKMISESVVKALDRAISEGHQDEVQNVLREAARAIYREFRKLEDKKAVVISEAEHEMLMAAIEVNAKMLVKTLSESWLIELDRGIQDGHSETVQRLIEARGRTLCDKEATWKAAIEVLSTVMDIKERGVLSAETTSIISKS
jgi:hypothetical protein